MIDDREIGSNITDGPLTPEACWAYVLANVSGSLERETVNGVAQAWLINLGQLFLLLLLFGCLAAFPKTLNALAPRIRKGLGPDDELVPRRFFFFVREAFSTRACDLNADGEVMVRLCNMGFKFSVVGCMVSAALVPIYGMLSEEEEEVKGVYFASNLPFTSWTITNANTSRQFLAAGIGNLVISGAFFYVMWNEWLGFVKLRHRHAEKRANGSFGASAAQAQHSILLEGIPDSIRNADMLRGELERGLGGVHSCTFVEDTRYLYALKALDEANNCLETTAVLCKWGDRANEKAARLRDKIGQADDEGCSTAFVTFSSFAKRTEAMQLILFEPLAADGSRQWVVHPAPEARDIIWWNASIPMSMVTVRHRFAALLSILGVLFWSFPVITLQLLVSVESLEARMPSFTQWLREHNRRAFDVLIMYLPVLVLMGLQTLLPYALKALSYRLEGCKMKSHVERIALGRNIAYQLATLYMTLLSGSLFDLVKVASQKPACVMYLLGLAVPRSATFFHVYVIARIGTSLPLLLLYPLFFGGAWCDTYPCDFVYEVTALTLVLVLGLTYAVVSPLIMPACALYFGMASLLYRYLFLHVYTAAFDCEGTCWYRAAAGAIVGLLLGSLSMVGIALRCVVDDSLFFWSTLIPPVLTLYFAFKCKRLYNASMSIPFERARHVDAHRASPPKFEPDYFVDPISAYTPALFDEESVTASWTRDGGSSVEDEDGEGF